MFNTHMFNQSMVLKKRLTAIFFVSSTLTLSYAHLSATQKEVIIEKNMTLIEIARRLHEKKIIPNVWIFLLKAILKKNIYAGRYSFKDETSLDNLLTHLTKKRRLKISIPEGYSIHEILRLMIKQKHLKGAVFDLPREGFLYPATYDIEFGQKRDQIIAKMQHKMDRLLLEVEKDLKERNSFLKTSTDVLILASIVEKETGIKEERALIARVFLNRLKQNMPLQADPTVVYGLTMGKTNLNRPLTKTDLKTPTPYNTYLQRELPPSPIACPGKAAIHAVLYPAETKALYFVADGTGGHRFSNTLSAHHENVRHWKRYLNQNQKDKKPPSEIEKTIK